MNANVLRRLWRDERGSMSLELALLAPVLVVIMLFVVMLGRLVLANQSVGDIAADAARRRQARPAARAARQARRTPPPQASSPRTGSPVPR